MFNFKVVCTNLVLKAQIISLLFTTQKGNRTNNSNSLTNENLNRKIPIKFPLKMSLLQHAKVLSLILFYLKNYTRILVKFEGLYLVT